MLNTKLLNFTTLIPLIFAFSTFPMLELSRADNGDIVGEIDRVGLSVLYLLIGLLASFYLFRIRNFKSMLISDYFFILFVFFIFSQGLLSQSLSITLNLILLIFASAGFRLLSYQRDAERSLFIASIFLFVFILMAFLLHGIPSNRWIGGIHPNVFSTSCIALVALAFFGPRYWIDVAFLLAIIACILVDSRYAIVCIVAIYFGSWLHNLSEAGIPQILFIFLIPIFVIIDFIIRFDSSILFGIFSLDDAYRGLGSGMTGRSDLWSYFLPQLEANPLIGYGFRQRLSYISTHNGLLNFILEVGILGAALFLAFIIFKVREMLRQDYLVCGKFKGHLSIVLASLILGSFFQPQLMNFGDPFGILILMVLFFNPTFNTKHTR